MLHSSLRLITPVGGYEESLLEMVDEYRRAGEQRYHDVAELARRDVPSYLRYLHERSAGRIAEQVIQHTFWLVQDRQIIGASRIRPCLTPALEEWGGNVAYDVRPSQRRQGYGTTLLRLTLGKAAELGLRRVLAMCYQDNTASAKVLQKTGAKLLRATYSERAKGDIFVYALDL